MSDNIYNLENVSKEIIIQGFPLKSSLAIDDENEIVAYKANNLLYKFNYNSIIDFSYEEDGETILSGNALSSAAGGLAFGVTGAIVGASRKQKIKRTVSTMNVVVRLNDLNTPILYIPLISSKTKTKSIIYTTAKSNAEQILAVLNYAKYNADKRPNNDDFVDNKDDKIVQSVEKEEQKVKSPLKREAVTVEFKEKKKTKKKSSIFKIIIGIILVMVIVQVISANLNSDYSDKRENLSETQTITPIINVKDFAGLTLQTAQEQFEGLKDYGPLAEVNGQVYGNGKYDFTFINDGQKLYSLYIYADKDSLFTVNSKEEIAPLLGLTPNDAMTQHSDGVARFYDVDSENIVKEVYFVSGLQFPIETDMIQIWFKQ